MAQKRLSAQIHGRVQGVYFRDFTRTRARQLGLVGFAHNLSDGTVEVVAEGEREHLEKLLSALRSGPPSSAVEKVNVEWGETRGEFTAFEIRYG
ncbi:MAG: acylphosphatase [Chloroflexi bacterium]|nr:acylphosphatase [Chloroflexota bacterium]